MCISRRALFLLSALTHSLSHHHLSRTRSRYKYASSPLSRFETENKSRFPVRRHSASHAVVSKYVRSILLVERARKHRDAREGPGAAEAW